MENSSQCSAAEQLPACATGIPSSGLIEGNRSAPAINAERRSGKTLCCLLKPFLIQQQSIQHHLKESRSTFLFEKLFFPPYNYKACLLGQEGHTHNFHPGVCMQFKTSVTSRFLNLTKYVLSFNITDFS